MDATSEPRQSAPPIGMNRVLVASAHLRGGGATGGREDDREDMDPDATEKPGSDCGIPLSHSLTADPPHQTLFKAIHHFADVRLSRVRFRRGQPYDAPQ